MKGGSQGLPPFCVAYGLLVGQLLYEQGGTGLGGIAGPDLRIWLFTRTMLCVAPIV